MEGAEQGQLLAPPLVVFPVVVVLLGCWGVLYAVLHAGVVHLHLLVGLFEVDVLPLRLYDGDLVVVVRQDGFELLGEVISDHLPTLQLEDPLDIVLELRHSLNEFLADEYRQLTDVTIRSYTIVELVACVMQQFTPWREDHQKQDSLCGVEVTSATCTHHSTVLEVAVGQ